MLRSRAGYGAIFFLLFLVLKNSLITTRLVADAESSVDLRLARILLTASWAALVLVFIGVTALRVVTNKAWWIAPWFAALAAGSLFAVGLAWAVIWRVCWHMICFHIFTSFSSGGYACICVSISYIYHPLFLFLHST